MSFDSWVGKNTVIRYMNWFNLSFFLSNLEILSAKIKNRLGFPKKAYIVDTYFSSRFSSIVSENIGQLMEQAVFAKLEQKRITDPLFEIFYWRTDMQNEVDFAVLEDRKINQLIQVTYASNIADIAERETKTLVKAGVKLGCKDNVIVTWDMEDEIKSKDTVINCIPLWKYLLQ